MGRGGGDWIVGRCETSALILMQHQITNIFFGPHRGPLHSKGHKEQTTYAITERSAVYDKHAENRSNILDYIGDVHEHVCSVQHCSRMKGVNSISCYITVHEHLLNNILFSNRCTLRKQAYSNTLKILPPKNDNFQIKILIFFIFLLKT